MSGLVAERRQVREGGRQAGGASAALATSKAFFEDVRLAGTEGPLEVGMHVYDAFGDP